MEGMSSHFSGLPRRRMHINRAFLVAIFTFGTTCVTKGQTPPGDYSRDCTASGCHSDLAKAAVVHPPVSSNECDSCHVPTGDAEHKFGLVTARAELCYECHDEDEFDGKIRHAPFDQGECTACHDPHSSSNEGLLISAKISDLCSECHEETTEDLVNLHGPVAAGACTACHDPHATDHPALLLADSKGLCLKCHAEMSTRLQAKAHVHEPAGQDCGACHNPHGGSDRMNLIMAQPQVCFECHEDVAESVEDGPNVHAALQTGSKCAACHDPHAADVKNLLVHPPMKLCLTCHNDTIESQSGKGGNIAALLAENSFHHGPIGNNDCTACHNPHAAGHAKLLTDKYPAGFYAKFEEDNYALCLSCHDVEIFEEERTEELTDFRNGDRNLHHLHVNRSVKGRTCRACHDPHAAKNKKLIAESVPFGDWRIPLNYRQTSTGGSCLPGCHRAYRYDRETAVANLPR